MCGNVLFIFRFRIRTVPFKSLVYCALCTDNKGFCNATISGTQWIGKCSPSSTMKVKDKFCDTILVDAAVWL